MAAREPAKGRSRVTNGQEMLPGIDGRAPLARRYRDLMVAILEDLGGADQLSELERQLVRRCAALSIEAENQEAAKVMGGELNLEVYLPVVNALGRTAERLGLKRRQKLVGPSLGDLALAHQRGRS